MRTKSKGFWAVCPALILCSPLLAEPQQVELPFNFRQGHMIVVKGSIDGSHQVNMMIDTGASSTIVDRRVAKKLRLKKLPYRTSFKNTSGRKGDLEMVLVPRIKLGPIETTRACLVGDIPVYNVDLIIGLNVLRRRNFSIDFDSEKIIFGPIDLSDSGVRFDTQFLLLAVPVKIGDRTVRLVVDSGAENLSLYGCRVNGWIGGSPRHSSVATLQLSGSQQAREVYVREFRLGASARDTLKVLVLKCEKGLHSHNWDGCLSLASLGLRQIHFDFERGIMSWRN